MQHRSYPDVLRDAKQAIEARDTPLIHRYAAELRTRSEPEAAAYADYYDGVASLYSGNPQNADEYFSSARAHAEGCQLQHLIGVIGTSHAQVYMTYGRYPEALKMVDSAIASFTDLPVDRASLTARRVRATLLRLMDDLASAYESLRITLDLARSREDRVIEALCLYDIGTIHMMTGDLPAAFASLYAALDLYEQYGNPSDVASALSQIGATYAQYQEMDRAREMFDRAIEIHTAMNEPLGLIDNYGNLGITFMNVGAFEQARTYIERAIDIAESAGANHHRTFFIEALATTLHGLGESDAAVALLDREADAIRMFPDIEVSSHVTRSKILLERGQAEEANALLLQDLATLANDPRTDLRLQVRDALRAISRARGDFDAYLEHDAVYNSMNEELRGKATTQKVMLQEKERELSILQQRHHRHLAVLYSTLPQQIADRIANGEAVNDVHEHASVLFLDIAGFTTYSSTMEAQETTTLLSSIFTVFDQICARERATKIKTIGDSYMAVALPDDDQNALTTEQRLARVAQAMMASRFTWPNADPIHFRIGLHTGPVVAGIIGTERMQYDVWGDTVNVASRMESTGEPGRIQMSAVFAGHLRTADPSVVLIPRGLVDIKGKGQMETYWLDHHLLPPTA